MMLRQLTAINVLLTAVSALCAAYIVRQLLLPMAMPVPRTRAVATAAPPLTAEPPPPAAGTSGVVVARNVFSPTRSEGGSNPMPGTAFSGLQPALMGVVLREGRPIAYLEDPATKRVGGYRIGDAIAGGTVESIKADYVVIARSDGRVEVRLHDPSRVRTAQPAPGLPAGLIGPGVPPMPGAMTPGAGPIPGPPVTPSPVLPTPVFPGPSMPNVGAPTSPAAPLPGRRPLLPNLLRRAPTPAPSDAPRR